MGWEAERRSRAGMGDEVGRTMTFCKLSRAATHTPWLGLCVPQRASRATIASFRHQTTRYEVSVENHAGVCRGIARLELDGQVLPHDLTQIALMDDGATHHVRVILG
jgi:hypothetical protein